MTLDELKALDRAKQQARAFLDIVDVTGPDRMNRPYLFFTGMPSIQILSGNNPDPIGDCYFICDKGETVARRVTRHEALAELTDDLLECSELQMILGYD